MIVTLRDVLNLFLGEDIFKGEGSSEPQKVLERINGLFEESRYDDVIGFCRHHVSELPRFRQRLRKDMAEISFAIEAICLKSQEDPNDAEVEWEKLWTLISRMEHSYGRRFHIRSMSKSRHAVTDPKEPLIRFILSDHMWN